MRITMSYCEATPMTPDMIRRQWVEAVMDGRFATANFLAPDLPAAVGSETVMPPTEYRDEWAVSGEILLLMGE